MDLGNQFAINIINSSFDSIITKDLKGIITSWNPAAEKLYGYTSKEAIGKSISIIVPEGKQEELDDILKRIGRGEIIEHFETKRKNKTGNELIVSISISPIYADDKSIQGACSIARDISEQKYAEERLRNALETTPDAMIILNKAGEITFINMQTVKLFGYSKEELVGQQIELLIPAPYKSRHPDHRQQYFKSPRLRPMGIGMELYGLRKNGTIFPVEISLSPLKTKNGVDALAAIRDISERKLAEERFKKILEATPDAMVIINEEGKINFINTQTEKIFGYEKNELQGQLIEILIPEPYKNRHPHHRTNYFKNPRVRPMGTGMELFAIRKNGQIFPVEISLSPLQTKEGMVAVAAIRDITDRKESETKLKELINSLERSNRELEHFAHIASHDLQEPLRMVASYTQLLKKKYETKLDEEANEFINYAVDGAVRMQQLIIDLMAYSRVTTKGKPFEPVDLNIILKEVIHNLQILIKDTQAKITFTEMPTLLGDDTQLLQVFQNLIMNAIKFHSETAPEVHIAAVKQSGAWFFSIKDNGIGIDPKYHDQIFLIFQRLHTKNEYPGTGIGLAICQKIIERHNGKIWVNSEIGKGAEFCILIPN